MPPGSPQLTAHEYTAANIKHASIETLSAAIHQAPTENGPNCERD
ncbi:hypothetical protein Mchl_5325 [Methylorubrum extorquens CM4]|uniref:Uncharacterized protein n=1 Tax=Methylorubrum extorquens (strain CM4 / NCIMB 13688) TaxID=440085 RepID=B7KWK9_METC4|nr:hypothetical protein Mchl_5325 [Methylorubrum extorquens CM4]